MKLEVKYWPEGKETDIDEKIDNAIEDALEPLGFERWASGFVVEGERCRDLAFERPNLPSEK